MSIAEITFAVKPQVESLLILDPVQSTSVLRGNIPKNTPWRKTAIQHRRRTKSSPPPKLHLSWTSAEKANSSQRLHSLGLFNVRFYCNLPFCNIPIFFQRAVVDSARVVVDPPGRSAPLHPLSLFHLAHTAGLEFP